MQDRTREVETNGLRLLLRDDGYRIWAKVLSGGYGPLPDGAEILWAEYKQCDFSTVGAGIADILMTPNSKITDKP